MTDEWGPWALNLIDVDPLSGSIIWRYRAREHFGSDQEWRRWNARYAHTAAFASKNAKGYLAGTLRGQPFLAHRVVWAAVYGRLPDKEIDHINGDRTDNRLSNLRLVSRTENVRNSAKNKRNTSGHTGVKRQGNSWIAEIGVGAGVKRHLGSFSSFDDAVAARKAAEKELNYSERHGK